MNNMVFICGASRSGTTLLMNLLDGHSRLALFPNQETTILQYWLLHTRLGDLERFFSRDYLNSGDVLLLTDDHVISQHGDYIQNKYGNRDYYAGRHPDRARFIELYLEFLQNNGLSLSNVYYALFYAALAINQVEVENKLLVEKRPLDNEIGATLLAAQFPQAKFIHILRDPRTRYLSAKMRRLRNIKGIYKFIDNYQGKDFGTAHAEISMVSLELARLNKMVLPERYHILRYEDLIDNVESEMKGIADFLGVNFETALLQPSARGEKISPSSSIAKVDTVNVMKTKKSREEKYYQNTSKTEQSILRLLNWEVAGHFGYDIEKLEFMKRADLIRPLKYENPLEYFPNRVKMFNNLVGYSWTATNHLYHALIDKFWQGYEVCD